MDIELTDLGNNALNPMVVTDLTATEIIMKCIPNFKMGATVQSLECSMIH